MGGNDIRDMEGYGRTLWDILYESDQPFELVSKVQPEASPETQSYGSRVATKTKDCSLFQTHALRGHSEFSVVFKI